MSLSSSLCLSSSHTVPQITAMPRRPPSPAPLPPLDVHPSPAAMADAVFPIEICERIIGHCEFGRSWMERYASLKAFSLVCRAWLPFALYCLYMDVIVVTSRNCFILLDVVSRYPHRAAWVDSVSLCSIDGTYKSVGILIAPKLFIRCKSVNITRLGTFKRWVYLERIVVRLLCLHEAITHLDLSKMELFSWNLLARLFRRMPQLQSLDLPLALESPSKTARKQHFPCCPNLRRLSLFIDTRYLERFAPLARGWLGCTALDKLEITMAFDHDDRPVQVDLETAQSDGHTCIYRIADLELILPISRWAFG
ncbi:hypothetical protein FKP32DRAFT_1451002 [Trametes sanguinea]|nr:hypothetical protein FKP32DRAFT_1451002 [Trametes sanguinea]